MVVHGRAVAGSDGKGHRGEMGMSRITDRPTPEWERRNTGNVVWSGMGRGEEPHLAVLFYCPFDVLLDMDDAFGIHEGGMGRFRAAAYAWDVLNKSHGARLGDSPGKVGEQDMATVYSALTRHMPVWDVRTCRMLIEPFTGGAEQARATRVYLFPQTDYISRALSGLDAALEKIDGGDYARRLLTPGEVIIKTTDILE